MFFFGNTPMEVVESVLALTGFQEGVLPINYLGLPLVPTKLTCKDCMPPIMRLTTKIDGQGGPVEC